MLCPTCQRPLTSSACSRCSPSASALASSLVLALAVGFGSGGCNESDDGDTSDDVVPDAGADEYAGPNYEESADWYMDTTDESTSESTGDESTSGSESSGSESSGSESTSGSESSGSESTT